MKNLGASPQRKFRKFEMIWLAYLIFFFIEPVVRNSLRYWLECIGIAAVFLALYVAFFYYVGPRSKGLLVGAMWLLGTVTLPFNSGATAFIIYAAAFLPFAVRSTAWTFTGLASLAGLVSLEGWWIHLGFFNTALAVFFIVVVGGSNIFFAQKARADCKLQMAHEEIEALAALAERERIARDLHDVLGHTLSVIVLKAELAGRLIDRDPQRAAREIAEVERTARTALAEVREAIGGYRARGLVAEIEAARRTLDAAGVTLQCDAMPSTNTGLRANEETVLALALREAVTNIVRHARATTCTLRFHMEDGQHRLTVADNGEHPAAREGNGLRGMRERVEALGGRVLLDRTTGTRLLIALPTHAETPTG